MYPHLNSGVTRLLELYRDVVIKHVAFFTIWVKLTMPFTCTSLPLNLVSDLNKNFGRLTDLAKKGTEPLFTPLQEKISSSNTMTTSTTTLLVL